MLSYRHSFHAGNQADVFKHISLMLILQALKRKAKPLVYLDTHAGRGMYSLTGEEAEKLGEYKQGILQSWDNPEKLPDFAKPYLKFIHSLNTSGKLKRYPGSPTIAQHFLDNSDRMILSELHPRDFEKLREGFADKRRVTVECKDGLKQITTYLPPVERRGLIFIDPSYEIKSDYENVGKAVWQGIKRFATGVYCIWYPVMGSGIHEKLLSELAAGPEHEHFHLVLKHSDAHTKNMHGSGLYIINPPFGVPEQLETLRRALSST